MGLKQDIVIVNEYTVKGADGSGSRGSSPGQYVLRYMARPRATETAGPVKLMEADEYITRYMARDSAVERVRTSPTDLKHEFAKAQGEGGVAFGYGEASLSDEALIAAAADQQRLFNEGKTVMKTVLSFDGDYLKRHGIVEPDFELRNKGDYRGNIDQMKLRLAIMRGLERMARSEFDELRYAAVIQVDTEHVHCHLSMVDAGTGQITRDGTQRGKLSPRSFSLLRRGLDAFLDEKQQVAHLSSSVGTERRNVTGYVKRWAQSQVVHESMAQFLLACLPADRRLWRSSSKHPAMAKPNRVVNLLVEDLLQQENSPMIAAMTAVREYAAERRELEGLSDREADKLVLAGRAQIVERAVNGVYNVLRSLPEDVLQIRTPMLDAMSMDYTELAERASERSRSAGAPGRDEADLIGFSLRLRSYSTRLRKHVVKREENRERSKSWRAADQAGLAHAGSRVLYDFYVEEEAYHAALVSKYRHFLKPFPNMEKWEAEWEKVSTYGEKMLGLSGLLGDDSIRRMKDPAAAESVGRAIYGQPGGARLVGVGDEAKAGRAILTERLNRMRERYGLLVEDLRGTMADAGVVLRVGEATAGAPLGEVTMARGELHEFEEVKALDLHELGFDFLADVEVGERAKARFQEAATRRTAALRAAVAYLLDTGQAAEVAGLDTKEILAMNHMNQEMEAGSTLTSKLARLVAQRERVLRSRTVSLDERLSHDLEAEVAAEVTQAVAAIRPMRGAVPSIEMPENEREDHLPGE